MTDTNNFKNELKRITDIFLTPQDNYGDLFNEADALYQLLLTVSGLDPDETISREDIYLPEGKALGPIWAARCVKEFMRTKRFLSGIFKAVKEAQKRFPGTQLHILYAGTGPFATLILPLTTAFSSREICFTLLEINPHSIECLRRTLKAFEIEDYVNDIVCCDAARDKGSAKHRCRSRSSQQQKIHRKNARNQHVC